MFIYWSWVYVIAAVSSLWSTIYPRVVLLVTMVMIMMMMMMTAFCFIILIVYNILWNNNNNKKQSIIENNGNKKIFLKMKRILSINNNIVSKYANEIYMGGDYIIWVHWFIHLFNLDLYIIWICKHTYIFPGLYVCVFV